MGINCPVGWELNLLKLISLGNLLPVFLITASKILTACPFIVVLPTNCPTNSVSGSKVVSNSPDVG